MQVFSVDIEVLSERELNNLEDKVVGLFGSDSYTIKKDVLLHGKKRQCLQVVVEDKELANYLGEHLDTLPVSWSATANFDVIKELQEKAAMFDVLLGCERIRVLGCARDGEDGLKGKIRHIGLELWTEFPEIDDSTSRQTLMDFLKQVERD